MFYDLDKTINDLKENPTLIFAIINEDLTEVLDIVINKENYDFNLEDENGNNVLMALLKSKKYDLVYKYLDKVDINHQNNDGDTLTHMLVSNNYVNINNIMERIFENPLFDANIKNNNDKTILDCAINDKYIYTVSKILNLSAFNSFNLYSFMRFYESYIKNSNYGSYSKVNNFSLLVDTIKDKDLTRDVSVIMGKIKKNYDLIIEELNNDKVDLLGNILNTALERVI